MNQNVDFGYNTAFYINSGLVTSCQQERLKQARITIHGMFAGGAIAIMLARSGIGNFTLIDHRRYSLGDINRDAGCYADALGLLKAEVIAGQIKRINPGASVRAVTQRLNLEETRQYIKGCDVYFAQSKDIAFSCHALIIAQELGVFGITFMPSGMTGYVEAYPPGMKKVVDPAALFGAPAGMGYKKLYHFLRNPLNRCGRRWHITEGKWRIDWFVRWRDRKVPEAQLCPNLWLGAGLASMEALKYITRTWPVVKVPKMWHLVPAENRIKAEKFRRRSWWFEKIIYRVFNIGFWGIGKKYQKYTARRLFNELEHMQKQENQGIEVKPPFMWRHLI